LIVEVGPVFGIYSYFDDPRQHGIIILYRAVVTGGVLEAGDDAAEVAFFAADALPPMEQIGFATHRRALGEWRDEVLSACSRHAQNKSDAVSRLHSGRAQAE
jgi:ADP-ribose pyrophosphatase YjhB (NUDIX family)